MAGSVAGRAQSAGAWRDQLTAAGRAISRVPFYPVLLVAIFCANLALANAVAPQAAVRGLLIACLVAAGLIILGTTALGDRDRGAAAAAAIVVVLVSTGAPLLLLALGVAIAVAVIAWWRSRGPIPWRRVTGVANAR